MNAWHNALDNALQAAELHGFAVLPLSIKKIPAIKSPHDKGHGCRGACGQLGHGVHDASTDPDRIREMFDRAPHATGYGIACGRAPHHLIGLDLDVKDGVNGAWELRKLAARNVFPVPRTVIIRTPSGGWHAWWTGPVDVKVPNRAGQIAPGIDVRGDGGYLVGPGSRGRGGQYVLASNPDDITVRPVPEGLLQLMVATKHRERPAGAGAMSPADRFLMNGGSGGSALVGLVRHVLDAAEGTRNERLYWAACKAFEHSAAGRLDADAAERALLRAAREVGLPDREADNTVASARGAVMGAVQ